MEFGHNQPDIWTSGTNLEWGFGDQGFNPFELMLCNRKLSIVTACHKTVAHDGNFVKIITDFQVRSSERELNLQEKPYNTSIHILSALSHYFKKFIYNRTAILHTHTEHATP